MLGFERERNGIGHEPVERHTIAPMEGGAVGPCAIHEKIQKTANARFGGEYVLAGGAAPHRRQFVDRLSDPDADVLAAFVPAAVTAHHLAPDGKDAVLPH